MTRTFAMLAGVLACVLGAAPARAQQYPAPELLSVLFTGWTTGGRPVSPAAGTMGYNTSLNQAGVTSTRQEAMNLTLAALTALIASLPTVRPAARGQLWLNLRSVSLS